MNKEVTFEDFKKFIKVNNQIIVKPTNLNQGRGINLKVYDISNQSSILSDYERFIKDKALIEERLFNHKKINQLNDTSLNSIRIYTVTDGVEVQIIKSLIRVGRKGSFIDNYHAGGLGASINSVTGKIDSDGVNFNNEIFSKHPDSGMEFKGFQIPMWEEVLSLVKEASLLNTKNKFVAWDIAITDNGVDIIE